jgi:hypothetical protein
MMYSVFEIEFFFVSELFLEPRMVLDLCQCQSFDLGD